MSYNSNEIFESISMEQSEEFVPLFEDGMDDFRLAPLRKPDCTVGICLKEPDENDVGTYIVEKDGWWAVADVDASFIPAIKAMRTPFAFTSITKPADFAGCDLLVNRFGKKGVFNWENKSYPVACEYDNVTYDDGWYKAWHRGEMYTAFGNGMFLPGAKSGEQKEAEKKPEAKAEAPKAAPAHAPKPEPKMEEKKIDPNVPTLSTFGEYNTFRSAYSCSPRGLYNGKLEINTVYCGEDRDDPDPNEHLYGSYNIYKFERAQRTGVGGRPYTYEKETDIGLTKLAAYALTKDGIFYAKDNKIWFKNIYGETKLLAEQRNVRSITDEGKGTLAVEYVKDIHAERLGEYRSMCGDNYDGYYDTYAVDVEIRKVSY